MRPILPLPGQMNAQDGSLWLIGRAITWQNLGRAAVSSPFQPARPGPFAVISRETVASAPDLPGMGVRFA